MRVLHVIESLDPSQGGPQCSIIHHASAQRALGADVAIASYVDDASEARIAEELGAAPDSARFTLHKLPRESGVGRPFSLAASSALGPLIARADFVHLHGVWEPLLIQAARAARRLMTPYCLTAHGMLDPWSLAQKRLKKRLALLSTHRRMLRGARFLHLLNGDERALIAPLRLNPSMVMIANGVNFDEIAVHAVRGRFRAALPTLGDHPFILFLSRLHPKKGLDILAMAFSRLAKRRPDVDLVVIGPDGGAESDFRSRIAAAGLESRVHLLGPVFGSRKFEALADCACFCLPSRQEGFSIAIIEALACGAPVLISEGCHFPEVAAASAGRVLPLSVDAFADAMEEAVSDPAAAAAMGSAARRLVSESYTWPVIAAEMLRAYEEFADRTPVEKADAAS